MPGYDLVFQLSNAGVYKCLGMINANVDCPSFSALVERYQISMGNTLLKVNMSFKKLAA